MKFELIFSKIVILSKIDFGVKIEILSDEIWSEILS